VAHFAPGIWFGGPGGRAQFELRRSLGVIKPDLVRSALILVDPPGGSPSRSIKRTWLEARIPGTPTC